MEVNWGAFTGVVALAYLIPGPDFAVVLRAAARGWRAGAAAATGAQLGLCGHTLLAVVGLSAVLARHPEVLTTIRLLGGAYLLYLGGRLVLPTFRPAKQPQLKNAEPTLAPRAAFAQGLLTNIMNPKAVLFFAAVLPQFVSAGATVLWVQIATLGLYDVALGLPAWALIILLGVRLAQALRGDRTRRWWDRTIGVVLSGIGGGLLLSHG